jgi:hypothetical protein
MTSHRIVEVLVGAAVLGYCAYAIYSGQVFGRTRSFDRRQEPWKFWVIILAALASGVAFLFGAVRWR